MNETITTAELILQAKLPNGCGLRDIADTQISYRMAANCMIGHRPLKPLAAAKAIAADGQAAIDRLAHEKLIRLTSYSNSTARYTPGHGIVVRYPSGRLVAVAD